MSNRGTLYRGTILDTPESPVTGGALRAEADGALLVRDGTILERGAFAALHARHREM